MASNTDLADINEILLGYYLNGQEWYDNDAKKQYEKKKKVATEQELLAQDRRASAMADEVIKWAKANGFSGKVSMVWWTARPGVLANAVGKDVDSRKNPTDILIKFSDKKFLGVSAKSTKGKGDIGFKNPGMGTIEKSLKIDLKSVYQKFEADAIKKYKLPSSTSERKSKIRKDPALQSKTQALGSKALESIRDAMFKKLNSMSQNDIKKYIMTDWMDSSQGLYPPYIKATGMGNKEPFTAKIDDPLNNDKLKSLQKSQIKLEKIGNESIGVSAGGKKIMKMRAKFESEKLASSIKFSGDPW